MIVTILKEYAASTIAVSLLGLFLEPSALSTAILLLYAPLISVLNKIYLRKERSLSMLLGFDSVFFVIATIIFILEARELSIIERLISIPLFTAFTAYAIKDSIKEPVDYSILRIFDFTLITFLVIFGYSSFYGNLDKPAIFIQLSGIVTSLFALITERAGGIKKLRPSTIAIMAATSALVLLLSHYASILGDGAIYLGNLIMAIGYMFYRFFDWLFSLIPKFPPVLNNSYIPNASDNKYRNPDVLTSTISDNTFKLIIICIMTLVALIILVLVLRKVKVRHNGKERNRDVTRISSMPFLKAISNAISSVKRMIKLQGFIHRNKNNSIGLALWLERKLRRTGRCKRDGECYYDFAVRLAGEYNRPELLSAAADIDRTLYSGEKNMPSAVPSAKEIRRAVRKEIITATIEKRIKARKQSESVA